MGAPKDVTKLIRKARKQGWTVEHTGGSHLKWTPPDGPFVITAQTPRRTERLMAKLRKAGLEING
jgi:predicted RNA binding protein YcfA (HicA-like mRNA interferase family)